MRVRKNPMIPLTAVAAGLLAGAVGTVCLDAVHYLKYRGGGGTDSPAAWEFAPVENWEAAPDPGQVAKRVIEGFTQRKLPDRSAQSLIRTDVALPRPEGEFMDHPGRMMPAHPAAGEARY